MKYKIEIWQWHSISETYESDNIEDILDWYKSNWLYCYEIGQCTFCVYENERELSFEEENSFGFH